MHLDTKQLNLKRPSFWQARTSQGTVTPSYTRKEERESSDCLCFVTESWVDPAAITKGKIDGLASVTDKEDKCAWLQPVQDNNSGKLLQRSLSQLCRPEASPNHPLISPCFSTKQVQEVEQADFEAYDPMPQDEEQQRIGQAKVRYCRGGRRRAARGKSGGCHSKIGKLQNALAWDSMQSMIIPTPIATVATGSKSGNTACLQSVSDGCLTTASGCATEDLLPWPCPRIHDLQVYENWTEDFAEKRLIFHCGENIRRNIGCNALEDRTRTDMTSLMLPWPCVRSSNKAFF